MLLISKDGHAKMSIEKVEMQINTKTSHPDFMSSVLAHNDEEGMTRERIHANAMTLVIAGSETTAGLLCGFTWNLLSRGDCLEMLGKM